MSGYRVSFDHSALCRERSGRNRFGVWWASDAKVLLFFTWFIYLLLIHYRLIAGWRGKRAAYLSIVGFIGVMMTFLGRATSVGFVILSVMQLALVGLSHKTAPVEVRERLAFSGDVLRNALTSLVGRSEITEAMILSTCNRVEVVAESPTHRLRDFLCDFHSIPHDTLSQHLYSFRNADAIRHVFRVASSLDSMMVGEPQILGQVKEAYRIAADAGNGRHAPERSNEPGVRRGEARPQ